MAKLKIQIDKLKDESDWPKWKFTIRHMLNFHNLLGIIDGLEAKPLAGEANLIIEWMKKYSQAQLIIEWEVVQLRSKLV